jgi:hypothetical protein
VRGSTPSDKRVPQGHCIMLMFHASRLTPHDSSWTFPDFRLPLYDRYCMTSMDYMTLTLRVHEPTHETHGRPVDATATAATVN